MAATKYDYDELEQQYVRGTMSIRQLCRDNDIKTWSTVSEYAKRNVWDEKREHFQTQLAEAETRVLVQKRADDLAKSLDDAVQVGTAAIWSFFDSLKDRWVEDPDGGKSIFVPAQTISAGDFVKIMEKLMVLNGQASSRDAHMGLNINVNDPAGITMEMLRDLASAARSAGADTRPAPTSPLPRSDGARQVN
jgi:hypothetical protein